MKTKELQTPFYVVDEEKLIENLKILKGIEKASGCHILLAQKAFSCYFLYPLIGKYINGTTASGQFEARLGYEERGLENHVFAPAYKDEDMKQLIKICDHIIINSMSQLEHHRVTLENAPRISVGLRINPQFSTQDQGIYDPCAPYSRLGITLSELKGALKSAGEPIVDGVYALPSLIEGLHFHTLCEQGFDALLATFKAFEADFAPYLKQVKWLNLGGGHHITRPGYDRKGLIDLIKYIKQTYKTEVYLEPGEAVVLNAGELVSTVCDIVHNGMDILILDTSAACHMPDVIEMPYRPPLKASGEPGEFPHTYRLSSMTCLAGDVIGDYSFENELHIGDRLVFEDMALYTMVKNNTFNGMPLPSIVLRRTDGSYKIIKEFGYEDFKSRLS